MTLPTILCSFTQSRTMNTRLFGRSLINYHFRRRKSTFFRGAAHFFRFSQRPPLFFVTITDRPPSLSRDGAEAASGRRNPKRRTALRLSFFLEHRNTIDALPFRLTLKAKSINKKAIYNKEIFNLILFVQEVEDPFRIL